MSWTNNYLKWLDIDDYLDNPRAGAAYLVSRYLSDLLVNRQTEIRAMTRLLAIARGNVDVDMLTRKEQRTEILFEEALLHSVEKRRIVEYIAKRDGVSKWAVYKRLERMDAKLSNINVLARMSNFTGKALLGEESTRINKHAVEAWMRSNAVVCCVCSKNRAPAGRFLCLECHTRHKPEYPAWVDKLVSEARRQHRSDARFALMRADELDSDIA